MGSGGKSFTHGTEEAILFYPKVSNPSTEKKGKEGERTYITCIRGI